MTTALPADGHVHSQWSWDALAGSMEETCRRAAEIGLPVHSAPADGGFDEIGALVRSGDPARVLRGYLAETAELISRFGAFDVLAHIDYPVRNWPRDAGPCDPHKYEEEYRHVLRTLAGVGKALEVNTRVPLHPPSSPGGETRAARPSPLPATPTSPR
jgi:histidinol phosphatase-like PHP family hydrolase